MQMTNETREKLRRYLINADPFLWNTLKFKDKKRRIKELQEEYGLLKSYSAGGNPIYTRINQDLLVELGVEGILEKIVVARVKVLFQPDVLGFFRRCWEQGQTPKLDYLKQHKLFRKHIFTDNVVHDGMGDTPAVGYKEPAFIFFQINNQHDFVERWTVFAGLWFEEIEPLLRTDLGSRANSK